MLSFWYKIAIDLNVPNKFSDIDAKAHTMLLVSTATPNFQRTKNQNTALLEVWWDDLVIFFTKQYSI